MRVGKDWYSLNLVDKDSDKERGGQTAPPEEGDRGDVVLNVQHALVSSI